MAPAARSKDWDAAGAPEPEEAVQAVLTGAVARLAIRGALQVHSLLSVTLLWGASAS